MTKKKKYTVKGGDFEALRATLKTLEAPENEIETIPFTQGILVENHLFSFQIPDGFLYEFNKEGFEVICYREDFALTPLQITVKVQPLILKSPQEHFEELKNSILNTKGMTMEKVAVNDDFLHCFYIPTLGGRQMFFPLYHTTELFSLRINFAKKITNADDITRRILNSFAFQEFTPRIKKEAVKPICGVFEMNRSKFKEDFIEGQKQVANGDEMESLCIHYANALFGCLRVLDEQITAMKDYDINDEDYALLLDLGQAFYQDMGFAVDYQGETFEIPTKNAKEVIEGWRKE